MKVLMINGSPDPKGCVARAFAEMQAVFAAEGIETKEYTVGNKDIRGCISCGRCRRMGECVFLDPVNEIAASCWAARYITPTPTAPYWPAPTGCFTPRPSIRA